MDNTSLRLERDRLVTELDRARLELAEKASLTDRQSTLIVELEEHVEKLQQMTAGIDRGEAEGRSSTDFLVAELDLGGDSPSRSMSRSPLQSTDSMQKSFSEASSLLPIVQVCLFLGIFIIYLFNENPEILPYGCDDTMQLSVNVPGCRPVFDAII